MWSDDRALMREQSISHLERFSPASEGGGDDAQRRAFAAGFERGYAEGYERAFLNARSDRWGWIQDGKIEAGLLWFVAALLLAYVVFCASLPG